MPNISEIIGLTTAASSSGLAVADSELIKGAFQVFSTLARLQAAPTARLTDGQIVWVEGESALYQLSITLANPPFTFTDTYTWNEFTGFGGGSVPAGTISGSSQIAELGYLTSASAAAAGFGSGGGTATDISALNTFTASAQTSLSALNSATSSYALKTEISGAFTSVSSSISIRLTSLETGGVSVPDGTISGSQQITDLGFINQSQTSSMSVLSAETASFISDTFISASAARSGFGTATLPSGVLSSSAQIAVEISGAFTEASGGLAGRITTLEGTSGGDVTALNLFTSSIQTQVNNLTAETSSYLTSADTSSFVLNSETASFIVVSQTSSMSVLNAVTASYIDPTFISASAAASGFGSGGGASIPNGTISGSQQITDLGFINQSQTSSMSVLSALTASFVGNLNYDYITNLPNLISSSTQIALLGAGILSASAQIAGEISGAFTSLSSSFQSRITALEGAGGGSGIFTLTGSFYSTTNNIQITGSLSVGSGSFKSFEVSSDGFIILGDMDKDLNNAPEGTIAYSGSSFYLIS